MKKQIINLITSTSIVFTINTCYAGRLNTQDFFIKTQVGGNLFNNVKQYEGVKSKAKLSSAIAVGLGYYILDNFRMDLSFEHYLNPTFKSNLYNNHQEYGSQKLKQNLQLSTLMLNSSIDVIDFDPIKLFLNAGVGIAKHKTKYYITGSSPDNEQIDEKVDTKTSYNFAYSIGTGLSFHVSDNINAELGYSWKNFGYTKPKKNTEGENISRKMSYSSHNLSVGFRIDL